MAKATPLRVNLLAENDGSTAVVELFEFIDPYFGFGAVELSDRLNELTTVSKIKLKVHSRGGNAMEGFALYSLLLSHPAIVEAEIIGVAASAASVVAMAADKIVIADVGFLMIHDPWAFADGNAIALRRVADILERIQPAIVRAYLRHARLSAEEISIAMSEGEGAGTWYDAEAAVAAGLAHEIITGAAAPENRLSFDDLPGVPELAREMYATPGRFQTLEVDDDDKGGDDVLARELLEVLRAAPRPFQPPSQDLASGERLTALLEQALAD